MSDTLHLMTDEEYYQANLRKMQDATAAMTEEDQYKSPYQTGN